MRSNISTRWTFMFMDRVLVAPDMARMAGKVIVVGVDIHRDAAVLILLWTRYSWHQI